MTKEDGDGDRTSGAKVGRVVEEDYNDGIYVVDEKVNNNGVVENYEQKECAPSITEEERQQKIARITDLRKKGLINEDLYQKAINNPRVLDKF